MNEMIVDLNKGQAGVDLSLLAPYVAGVLIHLGSANLNDPAAPIYDPEAANHIQAAANAKIPLVGISVDLNASMWGSGGWNVPLSDVKSQIRSKNPMYMFVKNFLTPVKTCQFIVLTLGQSVESAEWNVGELQAMIGALETGMKAGEIQHLKIMVATTPAFVANRCYSTSQKINLFESMFYHEDGSCPYKVMVQEAASKSGSYSWDFMQKTPPMTATKPSAYLGAYPNPFVWQWLLGGVYLPYKGTATRQFGISSLWGTKEAAYAWAGVGTPVTPPVVDPPVDPPVIVPPVDPPVTGSMKELAAAMEQTSLILANAQADVAAFWATLK